MSKLGSGDGLLPQNIRPYIPSNAAFEFVCLRLRIGLLNNTSNTPQKKLVFHVMDESMRRRRHCELLLFRIKSRLTYLFSEKSAKILQPELLFLAQKCTKSFVGWGFAPDPIGGAYSAPPGPVAVSRGPASKGMVKETE